MVVVVVDAAGTVVVGDGIVFVGLDGVDAGAGVEDGDDGTEEVLSTIEVVVLGEFPCEARLGLPASGGTVTFGPLETTAPVPSAPAFGITLGTDAVAVVSAVCCNASNAD